MSAGSPGTLKRIEVRDAWLRTTRTGQEQQEADRTGTSRCGCSNGRAARPSTAGREER